MPVKLTFERPCRRFVLDAFNKSVVDDYIVEKDTPDHRVLTERGSEIKQTQFAGVRKGSEIYIKANDIDSLINASDHVV